MAERAGVITLQSFLHKYYHKHGVDEDEFHRYRTIAADGLREFSLFHLPLVKNAVLSIDSTNYYASYPADYAGYVAIAMENNGVWWTFTHKHDMVDKSISGITGSDLSNYNYIIGPGSVGGENRYYFKDDPKNRKFLFDETYSGDTVVLRYVSTGVEVESFGGSDSIQFPVYAEQAMEDYIRWKVCEYDDAPQNKCERRKKQYEDSVMMMRNFTMPTVSEIRDILLGSQNATLIRI
jgi:hypothetical protein